MEYKMIEKGKDKLADQLESIMRKDTMNTADLDSIFKLSGSIKNLCKIAEMDEGGYSQRSYGGRMYSRDGMWDARGSYDNGNSYARDMMYSRADGSAMVKDQIRMMMNDGRMGENDRRILEKAMDILS